MSTAIRPAAESDASRLSELAMRSKAHWGYSDEFMASCRDELTVTPARIKGGALHYSVALEGEAVVGFCAVEAVSDEEFELEALFVEPDKIGSGIGRLLIAHAIQYVVNKGGDRLRIQSDPNAVDFYTTAGAQHVGTRESDSVPGRSLPMFEIGNLRTAHEALQRQSTSELLCLAFVDTDVAVDLPIADLILSRRGYSDAWIRRLRGVCRAGLWHQLAFMWDWAGLSIWDVVQGYAMIVVPIGLFVTFLISAPVGLLIVGSAIVTFFGAYGGMALTRLRLEKHSGESSR